MSDKRRDFFNQYKEHAVSRMERELNRELEPNPAPEKAAWMNLLKIIPMFNEINRQWLDTGSVTSQLININSRVSSVANTAKHLGSGFSITSAVTYGIDFIAILAIYTGAFLMGEKVPFTLKRSARLLFAGVVLGLTIAGIVVPPLAAFFSIATAGLFLGAAAYTFGNLFVSKSQLKKELETIEKDIEFQSNLWEQRKSRFEERLELLKDETDDLYAMAELDKLTKQIEHHRKPLQALLDKKAVLEKTYNKINRPAIAGRLWGLSLSALAFATVVASIFFPGAALISLFAISSVSLTVLAVSLSIPLVKKLWNRFRPAPAEEPEPEEEPCHESTMDISLHLANKNEFLVSAEYKKQHQERLSELKHWAEKGDLIKVRDLSQTLLQSLSEHQDIDSLYDFFNIIAKIKLEDERQEEIREQFLDQMNYLEPALTLVINELGSIEEEKAREKIPEVLDSPLVLDYFERCEESRDEQVAESSEKKEPPHL